MNTKIIVLSMALVLLALVSGVLVWEYRHRVDYARPGLQTIAVESFALEDVGGKVVYLDFWASWCLPCRESFPWMQQMATKYHDRGLRVIAINLDQSEDEMMQFIETFGANFMVVKDPSYSLFRSYQVTGVPTSIVYDTSGGTPLQVEVHQGFNQFLADKAEMQIVRILDQSNG